MSSGSKKRHEKPSESHSILSETLVPPKMATIKEASTSKDAGSESGADLQGTIAKLKPPDPSVTTRKEMNSGLMKTNDKPGQTASILSKKNLPP